MKIPVVITEIEYNKGKKVFDGASARFDWNVTSREEEKVADAIRTSGARIAVVGVEKYTGPLYEALGSNAKGEASLIARYGVGYDGIDLAQCKSHGVYLTITPGALDNAVAEHAMALILACARNLVSLDSQLRSGIFANVQGFELAGKTLGIVGLGNIGKRVSHIAAFGFGMKVIVYDTLALEDAAQKEKSGTDEFRQRYGIADYATEYESCAKKADLLSLHMPVLPSTVKFMNAERFGKMKPGSIFINSSRGKLVDEADLYDALVSGQLLYAGLDVFEREPYEPVHPDKDLRKLPNIVLTSHTASNTVEANFAMQSIVLQNMDAYLVGDFGRLTAVRMP